MRLTVETRLQGAVVTVAAMAMGVAACVAVAATATQASTAINPLMLLAALMHVGFLVVGTERWVAASSVPMLAAVVIESGFSDEPSWMRAIVLGCWWFATMELSWEAIDRRYGARYTRAATLRRVQEVVTVLVIALVIGLVASGAAAVAPTRTVVMQAVVLGGLLAAFVWLIRHVTANEA